MLHGKEGWGGGTTPSSRRSGSESEEAQGLQEEEQVQVSVVPFDDGLSKLVMSKAQTTELHDYSVGHGAITLRDDAITKVKDGLTTVEEALRVTRKEGL